MGSHVKPAQDVSIYIVGGRKRGLSLELGGPSEGESEKRPGLLSIWLAQQSERRRLPSACPHLVCSLNSEASATTTAASSRKGGVSSPGACKNGSAAIESGVRRWERTVTYLRVDGKVKTAVHRTRRVSHCIRTSSHAPTVSFTGSFTAGLHAFACIRNTRTSHRSAQVGNRVSKRLEQ